MPQVLVTVIYAVPVKCANFMAMRSFIELPYAYLQERAELAGLTVEQTKLFLLKFHHFKHNRDVASELDITVNACVQCLGEIYRKFGIEGRGRGKENRLRQALIQAYKERSDDNLTVTSEHDHMMVTLRPLDHQERSSEALTRFAQTVPAANPQFLRGWVRSLRYSQETLAQEDGQEMVDDILRSLLKTLPGVVTALAADTPNTKAVILGKILERLDQLVLELQPRVEKNRLPQLRFFLQENSNPLARSLFAFVLRLRSQLGFGDDVFKPWEVIDQAMEQVSSAHYQLAIGQPRGMKAYSQLIRQLCFEFIYRRAYEADQQGNVSTETIAVSPERLRRDLHAVDHALLDLYLVTKQRTEANIDFFHILRTRWLEPMEWGTFSADISGSRNFLGMTLSEQWDFEIKALRALRAAYHNYDHDSFEPMYAKFEEKVSQRRVTYCEKLFYPPEISPEGFYKLVAVPREANADKGDIWLSNRVWRYATLLAQPHLSLEDLNEIRQLLNDAASRPGLDFWLREVDHFIAHETEEDPDSLLAIEASQRAELKKHSIRL